MRILNKILWKYYKPKIFGSYLIQKKIRNLPVSEIEKIQWQRLKSLLESAYSSSKFYHDLFNSVNLKPLNIKNYTDFRKIPIVNKKILKNNYEQIKSNNALQNDFILSYTSGSTGEPFSFLIDKKGEAINTFAAFMLNKENVGINPFDKNNELMIKAEPKNQIKNLNMPIRRDLSHRIKYFFSSEIFGIKSLDINREKIKYIESIIKEKNIVGIYGYSSNVFYLAKLFNIKNININLKYIILIAEGILKQQKNFISRVFNCPVYMDYGASECMRMGFECNQQIGYHMDLYNYFFEYLDEKDEPCKAGEKANLVVTNLNNNIFPLIRYRIGDKVIFSDKKCSCGVNYPIISNIMGRKSDYIKNDAGDEISLANFDVFFEYLHKYISQYQIIFNRKKREMTIKIVPTDQFQAKLIDDIKKDVFDLTNFSMKVKIKLVEYIPFGKNGKTKILINE